MGNVQEIDRENKKVILKSKKVYPFDYLVICTGARHSYFGNDEWEKYAKGLKDINDALSIRETILMSFEKAEREKNIENKKTHLNFVIVGGGPTGVEMAGSIADIAYNHLTKDFRNFDTNDARIYIIEAGDRILPMFDEKLSNQAKTDLENFGVVVRCNERVTNIDKGFVKTNKDTIQTNNIIWAAGNQAEAY